MGFFKKEEINESRENVVKEVNNETNELKKTNIKRKNLSLFDVDTIQYIIDNFPSMSIDIQGALINLSSILENTINHIEDKSSELIKENRNFELSQAYRDTSISIYEVVKNIEDYVLWMKAEYEKDVEKKQIRKNELDSKEVIDEVIEQEDFINENNEQININMDFSFKEPKAFILKDNIISVENWDDLLVKTAEVLTKKYKNNKYSDKIVESIETVGKKCIQNDFRDTAIEMLNEYNVSLLDYKVIVK